jgi:DNA repair protein RadC
MKAKQQDAARYEAAAGRAADASRAVNHAARACEDDVIADALDILQRRAARANYLSSPKDVQKFLTVALSEREHESFGVIMLDSQHGVLGMAEMFHGTLTQTSVYPREVAKTALHANAAAIVLYHNHPSGQPEPSNADKMLTATLKRALELFDIRVLDHIVVGGGRFVSLAERGLI